MKKFLFALLTAAMLFGCLSLVSCGDKAGDDGTSDSSPATGNYVGKAFTFKEVESDDNKPEEQTPPKDDSKGDQNDDDNDDSDDDDDSDDSDDSENENGGNGSNGGFGDGGDGQGNGGDSTKPAAQDYTETETVKWIYFQNDTRVVWGDVQFTVTYDGETDEEKSRTEVSGSLRRLYYGSYQKAQTTNAEIPLLDLINNNPDGSTDDSKWQRMDKPFNPEKGFEIKGAQVASKDYEFGTNKKDDLKIKLTTQKTDEKTGSAYQEWTIWTWAHFEVRDGMKVTVENFDNDVANSTFTANDNYSTTDTYVFNNDGSYTYTSSGRVSNGSKWSTLKNDAGSSILIKEQEDSTTLSLSYFTTKVKELPRVKEDIEAGNATELSQFFETELVYIKDSNGRYFLRTHSNGVEDETVSKIISAFHGATLESMMMSSSGQGGDEFNYGNGDGFKTLYY